MRYLRGLCVLAILLAVFVAVRPACAQDDPNFETGIKPYGSYNGGDIDAIGLTNGELSVDIPLISYPQKGGKLKLDFHFKCVQSGYFYDVGYIYDPYGNLMGTTTNWATGAEFSGCYIEQKDFAYSSAAFPDDGSNQFETGQVIMSDNAVHQLAPISSDGSKWEATDASGFHASNYAYTAFLSVTDSDGITYKPAGAYQSTFVGGSATDTNGNAISLTASGNNYTGWVDSVGRTIAAPVEISPDNPTLDSECPTQYGTPTAVMSWNPPGVNGGSYPILLCEAGSVPYSYYYWNTNNGQGEGWQDQYTTTTAEYMMLVLPNHTAWVFQYTSDGNADIQQIAFPTGGTVSYTYENGAIFQDNHTFVARQAVVTRAVNPNDGISAAGTWTYHYTVPTSANTVTDPQGNEIIHHFAVPTDAGGIYETETDFYQGSSTLLKRVNTSYTATGTAYPSYLILGAVPTQMTTTWANGQQSNVTYSYDSGFNGGEITQPDQGGGGGFTAEPCCTYGKEISKNEYDYSGSLLRTTNTSYQFQNNGNYVNANLLNLPATVQVTGVGSGSNTTYGYDETGCSSGACGNQTSVHRWLNTTGGYLVTTNAYDPNGRLTSTTDPKGNPTTFGYGNCYAGSGPTSVTNALSQTTNYCYDANTGLQTSVTDPNNNTTATIYDSGHQMLRTSEIDYPDGGKTQFCYTDESTCAESGPGYGSSVVISEAITSGTDKISTVTVDGLGRLSQRQLNSDPDGSDYTEIQYDNLGHEYKVYNPTRCSGITTNCGESTWGFTTYGYDALGRTTLVTDQDGSTVQTQYVGNSATVTDEAGKTRQSNTDALGRLTTVVEDPNSAEYSTTYSYDVLGDLIGVTQVGSRQRGFVYDSLSRLASAANPESGTTSYSYDDNGNVISKTDARNITTTYAYDQLNRLLSKTYSDPATLSVYLGYDNPNAWGRALTNTVGRLVTTQAVDSSGHGQGEVFSYDPMGRVVRDEQCIYVGINGCAVQTGTYDLLGDMASLNYASGRAVKTYYSTAARPRQVTYDNFNGTYVGYNYLSTAHYAPDGSPANTSLGNGVTEASTYNDRLQPCNQQIATGASTWVNRSYSFYPSPSCTGSSGNNGNVMSITDSLQPNRTQNFSYDSLNRLSTAATQATSGPDCWGNSYGYDPWGNFLQQDVTQCSAPYMNLSVNANNQITNSGFGYDATGNMTASNGISYQYDAESRLVNYASGAGVYTYDASGQRVSKSVGGAITNYFYFDGQIVAEYNPAGIWVDYVWAGDRRLAMVNGLSNVSIPNGSFENGMTDWGGYGTTTLVDNPANAHSGSYYLEITGDSTHQSVAMNQQIAVQPGEQLMFGGWVNLQSGGGGGCLGWTLAVWDASYNVIAAVQCDSPSSSGWTYQETTYIVPSNGAYVALYAQVWDPNTPTTIWVDDGFLSAGTFYYHSDHLGSTRLMTDAGGNPVSVGTFLPFGQEWGTTNPVSHYKFDGKERDDESGLDNFGARYYTSTYGRFMSADWSAIPEPVPYANLSNPQTLNLYAIVHDNPETFADLDGHQDNGNVPTQQPECDMNSDAHVCSVPSITKNNLVVISKMKQSTNWETKAENFTNYKDLGGTYHWAYQIIATTTTTYADGSVAQTSTAATFSLAIGHEGEYLGATQTTGSADAADAIDYAAKSTISISQNDARSAIGNSDFTNAQTYAASPSRTAYWGMAVAQDARAHPGKYAFFGVEAAATLTPLPEAYAGYEGVKAGIDVAVGAAHLWWDLAHDH